MSREIAILAQRQYRAWLALAVDWDLEPDASTGQERCGACDMGIISIIDSVGENRVYTEQERMALIVGHLRNYHRDLEAMVYESAGIK